MRIYFPNMVRPKKAAKNMMTKIPGLRLAAAQRLIAMASGYPDWHILEQDHATAPATPLDESWTLAEFRQRGAQMLLAVTKFGLAPGDLIYALSTARLTGNRLWSREDHAAILLLVWRQLGRLGVRDGRKPGRVVRLRDCGTIGYFLVGGLVPDYPDFMVEGLGKLRSHRKGKNALVLVDDSTVIWSLKDVVVPRTSLPDFLPECLWLPVGTWHYSDGSEVLFSYGDHPLWKISSAGIERVAPWEKFVAVPKRTSFFSPTAWSAPRMGTWNLQTAQGKKNAIERLDDLGINALPKLADALPVILTRNVDEGERTDVLEAVHVLKCLAETVADEHAIYAALRDAGREQIERFERALAEFDEQPLPTEVADT